MVVLAIVIHTVVLTTISMITTITQGLLFPVFTSKTFIINVVIIATIMITAGASTTVSIVESQPCNDCSALMPERLARTGYQHSNHSDSKKHCHNNFTNKNTCTL